MTWPEAGISNSADSQFDIRGLPRVIAHRYFTFSGIDAIDGECLEAASHQACSPPISIL